MDYMFRIYKKIIFIIIIICFFFNTHAIADEEHSLLNGSIGLEIGIWKPSSLDDNPTKPFKNIEGADPCFGLSLVSPAFQNWAVFVTLFQWKQQDVFEKTNIESINLRHISAGLKNYVLSNAPISPFVCFGMSCIWSQEKTFESDKKTSLDRAGYGFKAGAGIDFQLFSHSSISTEFEYHYARFNKTVGLTDNYNGPKFSLRWNYLF